MVELILQAATRILERESLAGFNTNRVAAVAGISVGSLYQYFPNKAALMAALIEQTQEALAQSLEACVQSAAGLPLIDSLQLLARFAIEQQYGKPLLAAALDHEEQRLPVQGVLRRSDARLIESVHRFLRQHKAQLTCDASVLAARDLLTLTRALVEADSAHSRLPPPGLESRITRALQGYLQCPTNNKLKSAENAAAFR